MGEIAGKAGAHFHVDACWGGPALLVKEYRRFFQGIEKADSVSIDAHKLLYCPMTMGLILFRDEKDLMYIKHTSHYIIRRNSVDTGRFTVEGSRPFACLKPWAALKIIGTQGYRLLFKQSYEATRTLQDILDHSGNFETLNNPELFILVYRFIPERVRDQLLAWESDLTRMKEKENATALAKQYKKVNNLINGLNIKLHKELRKDDSSFVSRTTLESTRYRPSSIVVLRAVLINPLIDRNIIQEIVDTQNRIGMEIWDRFRTAYQGIRNEGAL
jgi:glutamate decarboxylase